MGIFYNPPPPPTANAAGTPPEPHVPIGTQGNPPPRYTTALMLVAVLASWPQDLEPRLARPNHQQQKIAPLTLTYGQPPAPQSPLSVLKLTQTLASWPSEVGPSPPYATYLSARLRGTVVVTQPPANQPQPQAPLSVLELTQIVGTWAQTWDAQSAPKSAAWNIPPIAIAPFVAPPRHLWTAWEPVPPQPPAPIKIAPLTLTYGSAPTPQSPLSVLELAQIVGSWPSDVGPQLPWPNWTRASSVAAAQPRADAPPLQSPLSRSTSAITVAAWATPDTPPLAAIRSVAWTAVLPAQVPAVGMPSLIWAAWVDAPLSVFRPVAVAPLTLPTGNAPPPRAGVDRQLAAALAWTPEALVPSVFRPTAGWNVPALTQPPYTTPPLAIRAAWESPFLLPPRPVAVAPLTLVYGAVVPPPSGTTATVILAAWVPDPIIRPVLSFAIQPGVAPVFTVRVIQMLSEVVATPTLTDIAVAVPTVTGEGVGD